jgi:hypothetical protein
MADSMFQVGLLMFGVPSMGSRRRKIAWHYALLTLVIGLALFATACGAVSTAAKTVPGGRYVNRWWYDDVLDCRRRH